MKKILVILVFILMATMVFAEAKIDVGTTIYNQYRWTDAAGWWNGNMGASVVPWAGRWNTQKGNFMRTEVEFEVNATISKYVKAYLRMKTIFDADDPGESSPNAAAWETFWTAETGWFKLRGFRIDIMPETEWIDQVQLGTPMGLPFNKWILSDRRYIDRDNTKGILVMGNFGDTWKWNFSRLWMPNWQTVNWGDSNVFKAEDCSMAFNIKGSPTDEFTIGFDALLYTDNEFDMEDPDNINTKADDPNGSLDIKSLYQAFAFALYGKYDFTDVMGVDYNFMFTGQVADDDLDPDEDNIMAPASWGGYGPHPIWKEVATPSFVFSFNTSDPFDMGFTPKFQAFYVNHNYISYWGSRREDDVLLINGGINGLNNLNTFLWGGGQSPVRHVDNDNLRLGEGLYESPVGYWGGTFDMTYDLDAMTIMGQFNMLGRTDNTGGSSKEKEELFEGDGDMFMDAHDYTGMVADLGLKGRSSGWNWGFDFHYGNWADNYDEDTDTDDVATTGIVLMPKIGRQLTNSISFDLYPAYQMITSEMDGETTFEYNQMVIAYKLVYNMGGFDFWLRGEHKMYSPDDQDDNTDDYDLASNTIHAAFEVKF